MTTRELRVVRVYEYGSYPWAIVTPDGTPVEVPRVVVRDGQELRFFGAFFPRKRDALVALDDLGRKEGRDCHSLRPLRVL